jgi:hypothetical protein
MQHWMLNSPLFAVQTFAFELLVRNDFTGMKFSCQVVNGSCQCSYPSSLIPGECAVSGKDVLQVRTRETSMILRRVAVVRVD